jgi:hypothetical protein
MFLRSRTSRRGQLVVLVAISLVPVLGIVAIVLDGGMLLDDRRRNQSAADAAALAAAAELYTNAEQIVPGTPDPGGASQAAALASAAANGFNNDGVTNTVTVNIPPKSGNFVGQSGYIEVIIQYNQKRGFSSIFGSGDLPVVARAVARGRWSAFNNGILVLNPTAPGSLTGTGGGSMTVSGASVIVDSTDPAGGTLTNGVTLTAPVFDFSGTPGWSAASMYQWNGTIQSGQTPTPDPLRYVPPPDPSTMTVQSKKAVVISNTNKTSILYPGVYQGGIKLSGQGAVTMMPGIYYMDGGGFQFSGQGFLTANGVMIYNAPQSNSDTINISGLGGMSITPPTSGPYTGISIFQARGSTSPVSISGNGGSSITGTFYVPSATLSVSGNGTGDVLGSQYISYNLTLNGGGTYGIAWSPQLTARTRIINLVE